MNFIPVAVRRSGVAGELLPLFADHKRWLMPMIIVVLFMAASLILYKISPIAPFMYTPILLATML